MREFNADFDSFSCVPSSIWNQMDLYRVKRENSKVFKFEDQLQIHCQLFANRGTKVTKKINPKREKSYKENQKIRVLNPFTKWH